jgi:phosphatidylserine/phosphatidylglycerophosphate/cardiolipin synthase-like enzyme
MARVLAAPEAVRALMAPDTGFLVERAPTQRPSRLFPSMHVDVAGSLTIQPVVSPDNYMDVVPGLLGAATRSITIEQQYIKAAQPNVGALLECIASARAKHPALQVRIILGKIFSRADLDKEHENLALLAERYDLHLDANIRYINTDRLVHCHNKMIIVDGAGVLVSSQNWSDFAVTKNREAGVWLPHREIAHYFEEIFDVDWGTAFRRPEDMFGAEEIRRDALRDGGFVKVERADYEDV